MTAERNIHETYRGMLYVTSWRMQKTDVQVLSTACVNLGTPTEVGRSQGASQPARLAAQRLTYCGDIPGGNTISWCIFMYRGPFLSRRC